MLLNRLLASSLVITCIKSSDANFTCTPSPARQSDTAHLGRDRRKLTMLRHTEAVTALQDGCRRLRLPSRTAQALVQFLSVKRTHDQFLAESSKSTLRMSPGAALDQLWHWMLLNTAGTVCLQQQCQCSHDACLVISSTVNTTCLTCATTAIPLSCCSVHQGARVGGWCCGAPRC